jgi:hypothetical protein
MFPLSSVWSPLPKHQSYITFAKLTLSYISLFNIMMKLPIAFILAAAAIIPVVALPVGGIGPLERPASSLPTQSAFMTICSMMIFDFVADIRNTRLNELRPNLERRASESGLRNGLTR